MDATNPIRFDNPWSKWPLIGSSLIFLIAGLIGLSRHHMGRGVSYVAIGVGMGFYGLLMYYIPQFRMRWLALFVALVAWFGGAFGIIYAVTR
ncbi:MAG: hypothetical protein WBE76_19920 [Terracidiphilus sp.]